MYVRESCMYAGHGPGNLACMSIVAQLNDTDQNQYIQAKRQRGETQLMINQLNS